MGGCHDCYREAPDCKVSFQDWYTPLPVSTRPLRKPGVEVGLIIHVLVCILKLDQASRTLGPLKL